MPPVPASPRIALFGGSFDPPHRGHVAIARAAADRFALDTVLFAPAGRQPLKLQAAAAAFADRLAMVALACEEDPRFAPSALDQPHADGEPNYTFQTLEALRAAMPAARIFNVVGADSFASLGHWREPQRLLQLAEWIVVSRPGYELRPPADGDALLLTPAQRARVHLLDSVHEDVAATDLRERLAEGDACTDLLPLGVAEYIQQHSLYRRAK